MAIIYEVTIEPGKEGKFHITWLNVEANTEDSFSREAKITAEETESLWEQPEHQLPIGEKLFRFLDGNASHLQRALNEANQKGESFHLHLRARKQTADWPFELLAFENKFLVPHELHLVRRVSDWGSKKDIPPKDRQLKLLFMACSALDVKPELDFEREEEAIFQITEKLAVDMEVDDSGSLEGLRSRLQQEQYDVVHLSGHANIDKNGRPYFIMEDETGYAHQVFPDELWNEALINNPPRLLFLSGCRTGEEDRGAAVSFARLLVENHHIPAVLGWGRSVADEQAIHAEKMFYHELSRGRTILDAVQRTRYELTQKFQPGTDTAWPLLRLFSSGMPLNAIVKKGQRPRPKPQQMVHVYLKQSKVQVLAEGFVGRRRQMQTSLRTLKQDFDKVGVLLLGTGGLGKSCLAGKICERFPDHTLIIVHGKFNSITLKTALKDAFIISQDEKGQQVLSQQIEMADILANLCATRFKEKYYLLLLDDFEQNLEGFDRGDPGPLMLEAADLLKALLHWLPSCGQMTQLIITSRYEFSLTEQDHDLVTERLEKVWLTGFLETERRKKARELKNILDYADQAIMRRLLAEGLNNPLFMERVDELVGRVTADDVPRLLRDITDKKEEFIHQQLIRELLQCGGDELARFLRRFSIYRRPVSLEGVEKISEKTGPGKIEELLHKGMGLSLIEHGQARRTYQLTPLLREELFTNLKDTQSCHQAAFAYYKKVCEARQVFDPILVEEWIFHALGCGEEETASNQGGRLVKHLRERLTFGESRRVALQESRRVGEWILSEKKQELANEYDTFLLNEIAFTLKSLDDYDKAIKYYQQALAIDRAFYGEEHECVARDLNNLGSAYLSLRDHDKAIEHYEEALHIVKSVVEEQHPFIGTLLNNLGSVWEQSGNHHKAIDHYEKALIIWKNVSGEKHPNVAITLSNLASAWSNSGNHHRAIEYSREALAVDREVYGEKHPETAADLHNLGSIWHKKGNCPKALEYYNKALTTWKNVYGEEHPNVALSLSSLGEVYFDLGEKKSSKGYFEQAYQIFKESFPEHPHAESLANRLKKFE